ncbi:hypothetical protein SGFS_027210 [Streptomyces graminofaciens]|uniref:Uncharacterized protein n=1 Tax=Streptomyces graminofaciens TaxID=68212 RepID=A0ABN5VF84_9ACTN|nr:hypothetical protein SGFS_027210 [Streptomyces graminofaciens]
MIDIVVSGPSGSGRACAAGPDISPAATTEAVSVAAQPRLLALTPRKYMGTSSVTAAAPRKLDPFVRLANTYDRNGMNFVLRVDKQLCGRYRRTG